MQRDRFVFRQIWRGHRIRELRSIYNALAWQSHGLRSSYPSTLAAFSQAMLQLPASWVVPEWKSSSAMIQIRHRMILQLLFHTEVYSRRWKWLFLWDNTVFLHYTKLIVKKLNPQVYLKLFLCLQSRKDRQSTRNASYAVSYSLLRVRTPELNSQSWMTYPNIWFHPNLP